MKEAYNYILNNIEFKDKENIIVAVSGGPDSMALLHLLTEIKKIKNINVVCAHVHHNVRSESDSELIFVKKFCEDNDVIFEYMKIEKYGDDNFHNEARVKRYDYFNKIIKKYNSRYLFTAHHGDDLTETILMRIVRGSTLRGYSGFSIQTKNKNYTIVRPLINLTKKEIEQYDKENKIEYVTDKSNFKDVYTRNRFRKYIVPEIKKEDPNVHKKFYKFSQILQEYNDYIDKIVMNKINKIYVQETLYIDLLLQEEKLIQKKIIYYILEHIYQDDLLLINNHHVELIFSLIDTAKANATIYLPHGIKVIKAYNTIVFKKINEKINDYDIELDKFINLPNGKNIEVIKNTNLTNNSVCFLSSKEIQLPIHVRNRKNGDKMSVKGMLGRKKINDIFIDKKIPIEERDNWPIVIDSKGNILWLPNLKKSKFDRTKDKNYDIILKYY